MPYLRPYPLLYQQIGHPKFSILTEMQLWNQIK